MRFLAILTGSLCSLALAAPAGAQGSWPADCKLVAAASLPFHLANGQLAVEVKANGTPRQFIISTGAFASSINKKVANELHLQEFGVRPHTRIIDAGGNEAAHFTHLDTLTSATSMPRT